MQFTPSSLGFVLVLISSDAWAHGEHDAAGTWIVPLWVWIAGGASIGGGVLATAFVLYYCYFARLEGRPVPALQPARAY